MVFSHTELALLWPTLPERLDPGVLRLPPPTDPVTPLLAPARVGLYDDTLHLAAQHGHLPTPTESDMSCPATFLTTAILDHLATVCPPPIVRVTLAAAALGAFTAAHLGGRPPRTLAGVLPALLHAHGTRTTADGTGGHDTYDSGPFSSCTRTSTTTSKSSPTTRLESSSTTTTTSTTTSALRVRTDPAEVSLFAALQVDGEEIIGRVRHADYLLLALVLLPGAYVHEGTYRPSSGATTTHDHERWPASTSLWAGRALVLHQRILAFRSPSIAARCNMIWTHALRAVGRGEVVRIPIGGRRRRGLHEKQPKTESSPPTSSTHVERSGHHPPPADARTLEERYARIYGRTDQTSASSSRSDRDRNRNSSNRRDHHHHRGEDDHTLGYKKKEKEEKETIWIWTKTRAGRVLIASVLSEVGQVVAMYGLTEDAATFQHAARATLGLGYDTVGRASKKTVHQIDPHGALVLQLQQLDALSVLGSAWDDALPHVAPATAPATTTTAATATAAMGHPWLRSPGQPRQSPPDVHTDGAHPDTLRATTGLVGDDADVHLLPHLVDGGDRGGCVGPMEQSLLLAEGTLVRKRQGDTELVRAELRPYIDAVLVQVGAPPLLQRCARITVARKEAHQSRTMERGVVTMEDLAEEAQGLARGLGRVGQTLDPRWDPRAGNHAVWFPLLPQLMKEFGEMLIACGMVGEALVVFERHDMVDPAIVCYRMLGKTHAAEALIRARLEEDGDNPALLAALGDLTGDLGRYEEAWEKSGRRYARAQRTLAQRKQEQERYAEAAEHWKVTHRMVDTHTHTYNTYTLHTYRGGWVGDGEGGRVSVRRDFPCPP